MRNYKGADSLDYIVEFGKYGFSVCKNFRVWGVSDGECI